MEDSNVKCYFTGCNYHGTAVVNSAGVFLERLCGDHIKTKYMQPKNNDQIKINI